MNSISDRTQCAIAWLPVIILLRFAHVIFIEINVDKIINAFTKIFFVNVVNVYHIYGLRAWPPGHLLSSLKKQRFGLSCRQLLFQDDRLLYILYALFRWIYLKTFVTILAIFSVIWWLCIVLRESVFTHPASAAKHRPIVRINQMSYYAYNCVNSVTRNLS